MDYTQWIGPMALFVLMVVVGLQLTVADFRRVLELDPTHGEALWVVGLAEAREGRPREAIELWERLLAKIDPSLPQHALLAKEIDRARKALGQ